jgi:hypothetical protein
MTQEAIIKDLKLALEQIAQTVDLPLAHIIANHALARLKKNYHAQSFLS